MAGIYGAVSGAAISTVSEVEEGDEVVSVPLVGLHISAQSRFAFHIQIEANRISCPWCRALLTLDEL